jgi:hypothetical protein
MVLLDFMAGIVICFPLHHLPFFPFGLYYTPLGQNPAITGNQPVDF